MFRADVITLFPELFPGPLGASIIGRAMDNGLWSLTATQLRDYATDKHKKVDDTPAGGGPGLVLKPDILARAIDDISPADDARPRLLMSPRGKPLTQDYARTLSKGPGAVIVCGRFEGIDQRVIDQRNLIEVSVGDYVLCGGEVAAMTLLEATTRLLPGVMGSNESEMDESFENGLLEYPQYTRPAEFEGQPIPEVVTGGDHKKLGRWRQQQAEKLTRDRRPDLWNAFKDKR